jgi:hypothetical protein
MDLFPFFVFISLFAKKFPIGVKNPKLGATRDQRRKTPKDFTLWGFILFYITYYQQSLHRAYH